MNNTSFNKDLMLASGIFKNNQELGKQLNILLYNHNTSTTPVSDKSMKKLTHNQKKINPTIDYLSSIIGESVPSSIFNLAINSNIAFSDFQHFSAFNTKQNSDIQTRYQSLYSRFEELSPWKKFKFQMLFKRSLLTLESLAIGSYETLFATEYREIPELNAQVEGVSRLLDRFTQEHSKYQSYKDVEYKEDKRLKSKDVATFYSLLTLFSYIDFPEIPKDLEELFLDSYPLKTLFSEDKEYTRFSSYQRFVIVKFRLLMLSIAVEESLYNIIFQEPCSDFASIFDKNTTSGNSLLVDIYLNLFSLDTVYQLTKLFNTKDIFLLSGNFLHVLPNTLKRKTSL